MRTLIVWQYYYYHQTEDVPYRYIAAYAHMDKFLPTLLELHGRATLLASPHS